MDVGLTFILILYTLTRSINVTLKIICVQIKMSFSFSERSSVQKMIDMITSMSMNAN